MYNSKALWRVIVIPTSVPILYSLIYKFLVFIDPNSFAGIGSTSDIFDFIYFSFVTFTTMGYGDMYPISPLAKIAVTSEAIIGILTIPFLIYFHTK
ncbi:potassium channel family protein [Desulfolucanica intricata]|uniref:potassium channel family protein n=1 Tax=Desulfolucanica intricata TaxID=1285191 RepID=UPI00082E4ACB|nr:potassium channel family protein [Desulfolucanica intricata]